MFIFFNAIFYVLTVVVRAKMIKKKQTNGPVLSAGLVLADACAE
jgi:hypothetical protein